MITVSKSSKLGRYYEWQMDHMSGKYGDPWKNLSLCRFVQGLFWRSLFMLIAAITTLILGIFTILTLLAPLLSLFGFAWFDDLIVGAIVLWGMIALLATAYIAEKHERNHPSKPKEPSIVVEWVKAKKNKVCPRINVID